MQNHRNFVRWQINHKAKVRLGQTIDEALCQVKDINYKGMSVVLGLKLPEDTSFKMHLSLTDDFSFDAEVWVVWRRAIDGINHYGLYFSKLKDVDKDKIYNFINKHCQVEMMNKWWPNQKQETAPQPQTGSQDALDSRVFERFDRRMPARFINLDNGKEGLAQTLDISAKGLGLSTGQELKPHSALEIWLDISGSAEPLYTRGEVAWSRLEPGGNYRAGVALDKADLMGISRLLRS